MKVECEILNTSRVPLSIYSRTGFLVSPESMSFQLYFGKRNEIVVPLIHRVE